MTTPVQNLHRVDIQLVSSDQLTDFHDETYLFYVVEIFPHIGSLFATDKIASKIGLTQERIGQIIRKFETEEISKKLRQCSEFGTLADGTIEDTKSTCSIEQVGSKARSEQP